MIVGIDLGTTNTVVAVSRNGGPPELVPILQRTSAVQDEHRSSLPSFLYAPSAGERSREDAAEAPWIVGEYARVRSGEVPGRGVASSKSWLSYAAVDRTAKILPVGAADDIEKVSPVEAATAILAEVRRALGTLPEWGDSPETTAILTVPASFDAVARHLTLAAARGAGLKVRLLEEPLAAFYCHQAESSDEELLDLLAGRERAAVLVCDVGGGTTDLSLLEIERTQAGVALHRTAVGDHLLLGGDNVDLALTAIAERRLGGTRLDSAELGQLLSSCRVAKEKLLTADAPEHASATLAPRGSALVGAARSVRFARAEVLALLLDGFLPRTPLGDFGSPRRQGLQAFGLPYAAEPAITRHVAAFLHRHAKPEVPLAGLLVNGGLFNCRLATERLVSVLADWGFDSVRELRARPDHAVALGAVAFGAALAGRGRRVRAGASAGYYLALRDGSFGEQTLVCVVPKGSEEAVPFDAGGREFMLTLGEPVRFRLFTSRSALHAPGDEVLQDERFVALPPIATELESATPGAQEPVRLEAELSSLGSLDLALVALGPTGNRFELAFDLTRRANDSVPPSPESGRRGAGSRLDEAIAALDAVFGKSKQLEPTAKALPRELERILGPRREWEIVTLRRLADELLTKERIAARRRSEDHERVFWLLAGFCLRPGFGYLGDERRVARVAPLSEQGLAFPAAVRSWQQYWIAWRRCSGGLDGASQDRLRDWIDPYLAPASARLKKRKGFRPGAENEMWELAIFLERADERRRVELGEWLIERTFTDRNPDLWRQLAQLGARVPTYASANTALPASVVERWLDHLLRERWEEVPTAAAAAVRLSRVTDDRARDVSPDIRRRVLRMLERVHAAEAQRRVVAELVPLAVAERAAQFGDDLPSGLSLIA